ncbi:Artemisinic aldehyde Delta(11(13)) reductase [Mycena venus]|uniref:Artemisinic aldehyde Delta(11(13)) reductase n=1 Tax=Mycena venus TaxID=2733690 RepID=A0A8H6Y6V6_9AGAR|nr:Artemisinic aldehyde Delta(11(13)) reductase [Mycena venus]
MSTLFTPLQLGSVTIPNRLGMSALTRSRASKSIPTEVMKKYYEQRARGGAGLIVSEGVLITRQGTEYHDVPGIWNKTQVEGWKKITDAVHAAGSKIYAQVGRVPVVRILFQSLFILQLWHLGRANHPDAPEQIASGVPVYAPSAIAARGGKFKYLPGTPGYVTPTELPDPTVIIAQYKEAAINAKEAGFDGVELHGANGYLVHQFLDSTSNKRTDKWGGSVENRARFCLEILKELIDVWGPDVALKLSPAGGYGDVGMELQETLDTFGYLDPAFLDQEFDGRLLIIGYRILKFSLLASIIQGKKRATQHDVLASYSSFLPDTKIFLNAGVMPAEAEELVDSGKVAGVFNGLSWIAHPDMGKRIQTGKALDSNVDFKTLYGAPGVDPALGYVDYKEAVY